MGEHLFALMAVTAASLLAVHGVARAQDNPWRIEPNSGWSGGAGNRGESTGQRAFEQGFQRGFEQGLRASQGGVTGALPPAAPSGSNSKPGAMPAPGATLGQGAGFPGGFQANGGASRRDDSYRWGDFPPLEGADPTDSRRSSTPPPDRSPPFGHLRERDAYRDPSSQRPAAPPAPYAGGGYPYGYGVPPYLAGPSTFGNPYGGIAGYPLVPGGLGYPGGW